MDPDLDSLRRLAAISAAAEIARTGADVGGPIYVTLPPRPEVEALLWRVINVALAAERGGEDLRDQFLLHPVLCAEVSGAGRPYQVVRWGVFLDDQAEGLISYGAVIVSRSGQARYDPRGLFDPVAAEQLAALPLPDGQVGGGDLELVSTRPAEELAAVAAGPDDERGAPWFAAQLAKLQAAEAAAGPTATLATRYATYTGWIAGTGLAVRSAQTYAEQVAAYLRWLSPRVDAHGGALRDPDARDLAVQRYKEWLLTTKAAAPATAAIALTAIAHFYDQHLQLGTPNVVTVKRGRPTETPVLTVDQRQAVLAAASRRSARDHAIVLLGLHAGPRLEELAALDVDDVQLGAESAAMAVRHGGRSRMVPLHLDAAAGVAAWLADRARRHDDLDDPALFISARGQRMATNSVDHAVRAVGKDAGLPALNVQTLRHTYGDALARSGAELAAVAALLGTTIDVARRYGR